MAKQQSAIRLLKKNYQKTLFGILFIGSGIVLLSTQQWLLYYIYKSLFVLSPSSPFVNIWMKMPTPILTNFYIFNWTNPQDFLNHNIKPRFQEVGPYRFMQYMEKINVTWNTNNTMTFAQMKYWYINEEASVGGFNGTITTINSLDVTAAHYVRYWNYWFKKTFDVYFTASGKDFSLTTTIKQYLVEGFHHPLVDLANLVPILIPKLPNFEKFLWINYVNGTNFEGISNTGNGIDDNHDVLQWNYQNYTSAFKGSCAEVRGSTPEMFSAQLKKDSIRLFSPHLCRQVQLGFEKEVEVDGILGYKYNADTRTFDNGTKFPENKCYNSGDYLPSGMINLSSCWFGSPLFMSFPHYYKADPVYLSGVEGLNPEGADYQSYFIIEPNTGLPLKASLNFQINIWIRPIEDINTFENVRNMYFPLFWIRQQGELPKFLKTILKIYLYAPYILIGICCILIIIGFILIYLILKPFFSTSIHKVLARKQCRRFNIEEEHLPLKNLKN